MEGPTTDFGGRGLCTAVGDVPPAAVVSSGEFTSNEQEESYPGRVRPDSEGFSYPGNEGIICPHLVQEDVMSKVLIPGSVEQMAVSIHKLNTSTESSSGHGESVDQLSCRGLETYNGDSAYISPSPSPLSEPAYEPYVICTKTRSETSCSNESQCSSSSGELLQEGWTHDKISSDRVPVSSMQHLPSSSGGHHSPGGGIGVRMEHIRWASPSLPAQLRTENSTDGDDIGGYSNSNQGENERVTMLISASDDTPQILCRTKPVLPPEANVEDLPPSSPLFFPSINPPPSTHPELSSSSSLNSSPTPPSSSSLHASPYDQRARAHTFHHCKAGEEGGTFSADYLGMKEVDMYIKSINSVAKELAMSQRPKEVQVFVTSERIRLAPPNSPTLFRSLLVKDILLVRKCSKNKRILGVMVWKRKVGVPSCHIMRCQDDLVASALYNAVWEQTQKVDEVVFSKVRWALWVVGE